MTQATALLTYIALLTIDHNGRKYSAGEPIDLTASQAEDLKAIHAVALPSEKRAAASQVDLAAELRTANERLSDQAESLAAGREAYEELRADLAERDQALASTMQELAALRADAQAAAATHAKKVDDLQAQLTKAQADLAAATAKKTTTAAKAT